MKELGLLGNPKLRRLDPAFGHDFCEILDSVNTETFIGMMVKKGNLLKVRVLVKKVMPHL